MRFLKELFLVRRTLLIIAVPIVCMPILFIDGSKEMACLYCIVIMGSMWITEALPIPVTALLPVVLFPALGVLPAKQVAQSYIKNTMIFSFSCLTFALSIERWNLHRRIALGSLLLIGSTPKWLILGFMVPTWFLSMWINNTSATAMMVPVVAAVLKQLGELQGLKVNSRSTELVPMVEGDAGDKKKDEIKNHESGSASHGDDVNARNDVTSSPDFPDIQQMCKALSLCVCYAATIGGTASLTGTSTNLVMQGQANTIFATYGLESGINFLTWLMCCFPLSLTCLLVAWAWLVTHFFGIRETLRFSCGDKASTEATRAIVREQFARLGPFSFAEKAVLGHFVVMVTLWLTLKMPGGYGWAYAFNPGFVSNSTSGIILVASLFVFPSKTKNASTGAPEPLLTWQHVQDNFAWGTWILLGGGFAMASACQKSGLAAWAGARLTAMSGLQPWLTLLLLSLTISFMTEVTSNAATATILGPIVAQLAISLQVNPLLYLYATALSCSMAFMLPVATAPNAIVFATGHIRIIDMVKTGVVLNLVCVAVTCVYISTWITYLLDLDSLPPEMEMRVVAGQGTVNNTVTMATSGTTDTLNLRSSKVGLVTGNSSSLF